MSDLDDDLLALAGEGGSGESSDEGSRVVPQKRGQGSRFSGNKKQRTTVRYDLIARSG